MTMEELFGWRPIAPSESMRNMMERNEADDERDKDGNLMYRHWKIGQQRFRQNAYGGRWEEEVTQAES
jgi:hypothetical protein